MVIVNRHIRTAKEADLPAIHFDHQPSVLHIIDNGHTIVINYDAGSFLSVDGQQYALKDFHFHTPSEEKIDGKAYEMDMHLVHSDPTGKLVVVAISLQLGDSNAVIRTLFGHLPADKHKEHTFSNVQIDLTHLLPADRGYYTFPGSLTTPPCTENVTWFVLKRPLNLASEEIERFRQRCPNNVRPTQPLPDRIVLQSK